MRSKHSTALSRLTNDILNCLTVARRRRILAVLIKQSTSLTEEELARGVGTVEKDVSVENLPADNLGQLQLSLHHNHLPRLDDVGLVEWNQTRGTVQMADHPVINSPEFKHLLNRPESEADKIIDCLTDKHRRAILDVLESNSGKQTLGRLVREMSECDGETHSSQSEEDMRIQFHHVHLPQLDEAGLIDYHAGDEEGVLRSNRVTSALQERLADLHLDSRRGWVSGRF